ncbi:MAG TPA: hypothetical protein P5186_02995 [Candidatus Paceibacterota bacterium]|nr:hypothetical protein [Verrucomicrobiota bacterium]HRY46991.1 hypothetical protein [Candidatus Paceibacterota bacterium]HRZ99109.1 hypothetical protein [Candidatus Paceibacterota bacterium]
MNRDLESMEHYLQGVVPAVDFSEQHRQELRQRILEETCRRQQMGRTTKRLRLWVLLVALAGIATVGSSVGVRLYDFLFEGQATDGSYHFFKGPEIIEPASVPENQTGSETVPWPG